MTGRTPIPAGELVILVECPRCHIRAEVGARIGAVLTVTDAGSVIRLAVKSKPAEHTCGQLRLADVIDADPLPFPADAGRDDDADDAAIRAAALDYQQRAAGEAVRSA